MAFLLLAIAVSCAPSRLHSQDILALLRLHGTSEGARILIATQFPESCPDSQAVLLPLRSEIQVLIRGEVLGAVASTGLLNVHQLLQARAQDFTSGGRRRDFSNPDYARDYLRIRRRLEEDMLGLTFPTGLGNDDQRLLNELLPKYGILSFPELPLEEQPNRRIPEGYGNVVVVLRESVKAQATLFQGDSNLNSATRDSLRSFRTCDRRLLAPAIYTALYRRVPTFLEVQLWGALEPSSISHFLVNCPGRAGAVVPRDEQERLRAAGFAVHQCRSEQLAGNDVRFTATAWPSSAATQEPHRRRCSPARPKW